ncbi:MAG TPA: SCO family protein [Vicinamibacterales bacterium]|nr:SCO family protein [Vicinamibacterales bacterium]
MTPFWVNPVRQLLVVTAIAAAGVVALAQEPARHAMRGMVLEVASSRRSLVVSHESVPGAMAAMTMRFEVADPRELDGVEPGETIAFTGVVDRRTLRAERIRVVPYRSAEQDPLTARRLTLLKQMTARPQSTALSVGDVVPDFTLTDQRHTSFSLSQLRGKVVALNFIYTSCALPQFCYRATNHFGTLQRRLKDRLGREVVLLTVTFDPVRDTPERLAAYAAEWHADARYWRFLTGDAAAVQRVCDMFGVDFFPDEGLMSHSVHTAVIDRQGRLAANVEGNEFTAAQLGDLVEAVAAR